MGLKHFTNWPLNIELNLKTTTTTTEAIQNGKRYLKTNYQIYCNTINYSQHKTHSLLFALYDANKTCLRVDSDTLNDCSE